MSGTSPRNQITQRQQTGVGMVTGVNCDDVDRGVKNGSGAERKNNNVHEVIPSLEIRHEVLSEVDTC